MLVASHHSLMVFGRSLRRRRQVSHPWFVNLPELSWDDDEGIWATSANIDAAVKVDRAGRMVQAWWPREDSEPARRFHPTPLATDGHILVSNTVGRAGHVYGAGRVATRIDLTAFKAVRKCVHGFISES